MSPNLRPKMLLLFVVSAVVLVHLGSLNNSFHYDDGHSIQRNPHIRDLANLPRFFFDTSLFSENPEFGMYRPLVLSAHALNLRRGRERTGRISHVKPCHPWRGYGARFRGASATWLRFVRSHRRRSPIRLAPGAQRGYQLRQRPFGIAGRGVHPAFLCGLPKSDSTGRIAASDLLRALPNPFGISPGHGVTVQSNGHRASRHTLLLFLAASSIQMELA